MIETLLHRGPDDYGRWISPKAALGHRCLIVVDPEGRRTADGTHFWKQYIRNSL